jgi:hypothetical protein
MNCIKSDTRQGNYHLILIFLILFPVGLDAQYRLNFGLREKQKPEDLPRSSVPVRLPEPRPSENIPAKLVLVQPGEWIITGGWKLAGAGMLVTAGKSVFDQEFNTSRWYPATVPGTVLTTLVDRGVCPDPYYGLNNLAIPDSLCRTDWWYRIAFPAPEKSGPGDAWLVLNGINYRADIWLNGKMVGKMSGAFCRGEFKVTGLLDQEADNVLAVHIYPPPNPGIPHEESPRSGPGPNGGQLCLDGPTFISSEGWDWVPGIRDRNIGIWQDVRLVYTGDVIIRNLRVITDLMLPDTTRADIVVSADLVNSAPVARTVVVAGNMENINVEQHVTLAAGETKNIVFSPAGYPQLHMAKPRLWWPNGYGKPELYMLELAVTGEDGKRSDRKQIRFGVRELSYELTVDEPGKHAARVEYNPRHAGNAGKPLFDNVKRRDMGDGVAISSLRPGVDPGLLSALADTAMSPYLVIRVNGRRIFCKGGNWGMDDAMKRVQRERLEPYFRLHRDAGFNMVRNWTGESTEEVFYDLCDEYGLLVWNDFWLSTEGYNLEVNDNQLFLDNARQVIRRFRNHPCIAIWCPRNEGYAPAGIEDGLAEMIASEDGTRYYQPISRYLNLRPSGPWNYFTDPAAYFRNLARGFNTEMGTPSIPTAQSMRKMMPAEDVWPISDTWYYHDLHNGQPEYLAAVNSKYGTSSDLDDFCKKAQLVNYDSHRAMFESWNSRMWHNTSGLLLWMTHPAWPSTVWQVYSWDYETFGSYFGCKKACEPVHVQMNLDDDRVVVVNTSLVACSAARVKLTYVDLAGHPFYAREQKTDIAANGLTACFTPDPLIKKPDVYLARIILTDHNGKVLSENDYLKSSLQTGSFVALNKLDKIQLQVTGFREVNRNGMHRCTFTISNTSKTPAIAVKFNLRDVSTGVTILPAYFSDGYINLLPGERREIVVDYPSTFTDKASVTFTGYNVN